MKSGQILLYIILALVLSSVAGALYTSYKHAAVNEVPSVTDFASCAAAGNAVMESYPRQCRSADGRIFAEEITTPITLPTVSTSTAATTTIPLPTHVRLIQ